MKPVITMAMLLTGALLLAPASAGADEAAPEAAAAADGAPGAAVMAASAETAPQDTTASEFDDAPKPLKTVAPVYPKSARKRGQEGTVYVRARVTTAGKTERVTVAKGVAADLDEAAVKAIEQWTFEPARKDGKAVPAEIMIPVQFKLDGKKK